MTMPSGESAADKARALIAKHKGRMGRVSRDGKGLREAGISERRLTHAELARRLAELDPDLLVEADAIRAANLITGPRTHLPKGSFTLDPVAEREAFLVVIRRHRWNIERARKELGLTRRTMYHRMESLRIKRPVETKARRERRRRRLLGALEKAGFVQTEAARLLRRG